MQATANFPDIDPVEQQDLAIDFSNYLQPNDTIASIVTWTASVSETSLVDDPEAMTRLIGPAVLASPTVVAQTVGNCVSNVLYVMEAVVLTELGEKLAIWSYMQCRAAAVQ